MVTINAWRVCDSCAVVVVNGDDSHLSDEIADEISATIGAITRDDRCAISGVTDRGRSDLVRCVLCGGDEFCSKALEIEYL